MMHACIIQQYGMVAVFQSLLQHTVDWRKEANSSSHGMQPASAMQFDADLVHYVNVSRSAGDASVAAEAKSGAAPWTQMA
jgi:hypothetical protein